MKIELDLTEIEMMVLCSALNMRGSEFLELSDRAKKDGFAGISFGYKTDAYSNFALKDKIRNIYDNTKKVKK